MIDNLKLYDALREPPKTALKEIKSGRLGGMTDINPMWRIKALTEKFGPCGIGWKYTIDRRWLEPGSENQVAAFVEISLYYKHDGEWSDAIPGTGGSAFIAKERNGLYLSDECYKMALTDALSVACKALGVAADVYWDKDRTKYDAAPQDIPNPPPKRQDASANTGKTVPHACCVCGRAISNEHRDKSVKANGVAVCSKTCLSRYNAQQEAV